MATLPTNSAFDPQIVHGSGGIKCSGAGAIDVDGSGTIALAATSLVFRPGEPNPSGNVFADWAALYAVVQQREGVGFVEVDDSLAPGAATVPAGSYDLSDWTILGRPDQEFQTTLTLADGVTFAGADGSIGLAGISDALLLSSVSTAPVFSVTPGGGGPGIRFFSVERGSTVRADGPSAMFRVLSGGRLGLGLLVGSMAVHGAFVLVTLEDNAQVIVIAEDHSRGMSDIVAGPASAIFSSFIFEGASDVSQLHPSFVGTFELTLADLASRHLYVPVAPAFWAPPPPNTVKEAIDRLAAAVFGLIGPIPL